MELSSRHRNRVGACVLSLLAAGCFSDVTDGMGSAAPEDTGDTLDIEPGEGAGAGLTGAYDVQLRTVACSGDCSAPGGIFGPISYCDVGELEWDYVRVEQDGASIVLELSRGKASGEVEADGRFSASGNATEGGGAVDIAATLEGWFRGRHDGFNAVMVYNADGRVEGDTIDCKGEIELTADWVSDECAGNADACPWDYPICYGDGCYAGVGGDPCSSEHDCDPSFTCFDGECGERSSVGGPCQWDEHCRAPFVCYQDACQVGMAGDPCNIDSHCAEGVMCFRNVCQTGALGDPCSVASDCEEGLLCGPEVCQTGALGDPCGFDDQCASPYLCAFEVCATGAPGNACEWNDDCLSDDTCA